jgi:hypothetical protein
MKKQQNIMETETSDNSINRFFVEVVDSGNKLPCVTTITDACTYDIIRSMVENDETCYGHIEVEHIPSDEIECYDWSESEQSVVDMIDGHSELYIVYDGIGDFRQPIGVVGLLWSQWKLEHIEP